MTSSYPRSIINTLAVLALLASAFSSMPGTVHTTNCSVGNGWTWTYGPELPAVTQRAQAAFNENGIVAAVQAFAFGETDSCGNFELFSTDFDLVGLSDSWASSSQQQAVENNIFTVLSRVALRRLGTVRIEDASGAIHTYAQPQKLAVQPAPASPLSSATSAVNRKVYLLVIDPVMNDGRLLHQYMGWQSPYDLTQGIINTFLSATSSHMAFTVVATTESHRWPLLLDGFRYDQSTFVAAYQSRTPHQPEASDYGEFLSDPAFDICGKLNRGEIDELWVYAAPWFLSNESKLMGPGAFWYNSSPWPLNYGCNRLLPIMYYNYERGVPEAAETFGHRTESTMEQVYGGSSQNSVSTAWNRFILVKALSPSFSYSGCGNVHYPANGVRDYDWGNTGTALSNCDDFKNYPNLSSPLAVAQPVTCSVWNCNNLSYFAYWYGHIPSFVGCAGDSRLNDWWVYIGDPNQALHPASACAGPPAAPVLDSPAAGKTLLSTSNVLLRWHGGGSKYRVKISGGNGYYNSRILQGAASWNLGVLPASSRPYQWWVQSFNAYGSSAWVSRRFYVRPRGTGLDCNHVYYNGVILYENTVCNMYWGGMSKTFASPTGRVAVGSTINNLASSVYIGSGWSVKVFDLAAGPGGSWRCLDHHMWDFSIDYYDHGNTSLKINNTISSIIVYHNLACR